MEIVFQKQVGRGRPSKMVKLEDGSLVKYKDYVAKQKTEKTEVAEAPTQTK